MTFRIDSNTFKVERTADPEIFIISGDATEDKDTVADTAKTYYPFSVTFNRNVSGSVLASMIQEAIDVQKPAASVTSLKTTLMATYPSVFKAFTRST